MTKKQRVIVANPILDCVGKSIDCRQHLQVLLKKRIVGKQYMVAIRVLDGLEDALMNDAVMVINKTNA